jgi:hypothetical protein
MQIGVELGKRFGVSIALKDLLGSLNTLDRLTEHLLSQKPELNSLATAPSVAQTKTLAFQSPATSLPSEVLSIIEAIERGGALASQAFNHSIAVELPYRPGIDTVDDGQRALSDLISRHEALRAQLESSGGWRLVYSDDVPAKPATVHDLRALPEGNRSIAWEAIQLEVATRPRALMGSALFECHLVQLTDQDVRLVLGFHQLTVDGWSLGILLKDLAALLDRRPLSPPASLNRLLAEASASESARANAASIDFWSRHFESGLESGQSQTWHSRRVDFRMAPGSLGSV